MNYPTAFSEYRGLTAEQLLVEVDRIKRPELYGIRGRPHLDRRERDARLFALGQEMAIGQRREVKASA